MLVALVVVLLLTILATIVLTVPTAVIVPAISASVRMLLALVALVRVLVRLELVRSPLVLLPMKQVVTERDCERADSATDGPPLLRLRHHRRVALRAKREAASWKARASASCFDVS